MEIRGYKVAQTIYKELQKKVEGLKKQNITPTLAVILVGNNPASLAYIKQKTKRAEEIGAQVVLHDFAETVNQTEVETLVKQINSDHTIHGIIIQQPLPNQLDADYLTDLVAPQKDVDGFVPNSPFIPPIALAIEEILKNIHQETHSSEQFREWLMGKKIVVIGKGKSGGAPVIARLKDLGCEPTVVTSKTENPDEIIKAADIVISAVGKRGVVRKENIKEGAILIGVGQHKEVDNKFHGDYEESEIEQVASFYTPTPGGVGVVNVACLLENLITAAENE